VSHHYAADRRHSPWNQEKVEDFRQFLHLSQLSGGVYDNCDKLGYGASISACLVFKAAK
jgi:hypothetical protein